MLTNEQIFEQKMVVHYEEEYVKGYTKWANVELRLGTLLNIVEVASRIRKTRSDVVDSPG